MISDLRLQGSRAIVHGTAKNSLFIVKVFLPEPIWIEVMKYSINIDPSSPIKGIEYERMCLRNLLRSLFYEKLPGFTFLDFNTLSIDLSQCKVNVIDYIGRKFREFENIETSEEKADRLLKEYELRRTNKIEREYADIIQQESRSRYLNSIRSECRQTKTLRVLDIKRLLDREYLDQDTDILFDNVKKCISNIFGQETGIYKITNTKNGGFYIGEAGSRQGNISTRWTYHIVELLKKWHNNQRLLEEHLTYGIDSFQFEVLEYCDPMLALPLEREYILKLKPHYNFILDYNEDGVHTYVPWGFSRWDELKSRAN